MADYWVCDIHGENGEGEFLCPKCWRLLGRLQIELNRNLLQQQDTIIAWLSQ